MSIALAIPARQQHLHTIIAEAAGALFGVGSVSLSLPVNELSALRVHVGLGEFAGHVGELLPLEQSLEGAALDAEQAIRTDWYLDDARVYRADEILLRVGPAVALPLLLEGEVMGALLIARPATGVPFSAADEDHGMRLASAAAAALGTARAFQTARRGEAELLAWRAGRAAAEWKTRYDRLAWCQRMVAVEYSPRAERLVWGDTAQSVFGYAPGAFGSILDEWAERLHADDREPVIAAFRDAAANGSETRATCRVAHAFGGYRTAILRCCGGDPGDSVVGVLTEAGDAGEIVGDTDAIRFQAVREIIRALRHEINNPLSVVIGEAQLLRDEALGSLDPALRHSVVAISEESTRINELVRRLSVLEEVPRESYMNERGGINFPDD